MENVIYRDCLACHNNDLSEDKNLCYSCDLNIDGTLNYKSAGILIELDSKIFKRANEYLKVDITNYGVGEVSDGIY